MEEALIVFFGALFSAAIGMAIGNQRGRPGAGAFWSLFLGPIGWLIVLVGPDMRRKCPECHGVIDEGARRCKHCGVAFDRKSKRTACHNNSWGEQPSGASIRPAKSQFRGPSRVITVKRRA